MLHFTRSHAAGLLAASALAACSSHGATSADAAGGQTAAATSPEGKPVPTTSPEGKRYLSQPLTAQIYTADPSAHVFGGKIYVYPSHDVPTSIPDDDLGNEYAMHDYQVLSMDRIGGPVTVNPVALDVSQVPWASKQMWAPDAAYKDGTCLLYTSPSPRDGLLSRMPSSA